MKAPLKSYFDIGNQQYMYDVTVIFMKFIKKYIAVCEVANLQLFLEIVHVP